MVLDFLRKLLGDLQTPTTFRIPIRWLPIDARSHRKNELVLPSAPLSRKSEIKRWRDLLQSEPFTGLTCAAGRGNSLLDRRLSPARVSPRRSVVASGTVETGSPCGRLTPPHFSSHRMDVVAASRITSVKPVQGSSHASWDERLRGPWAYADDPLLGKTAVEAFPVFLERKKGLWIPSDPLRPPGIAFHISRGSSVFAFFVPGALGMVRVSDNVVERLLDRADEDEPLILGRARMVWNPDSARIALHLPAVAPHRLPATWSVGKLTRVAAATPDQFAVNSAAFARRLILKLRYGPRVDSQRVRGLDSWGLFDDRGVLVNPDRPRIPLAVYDLVSREPVRILSRNGFQQGDQTENETFELEDGNTCFLTRLIPIANVAGLDFHHAGNLVRLAFGALPRIACSLFMGRGFDAARFERFEERILVEKLPIPCLGIPHGHFGDADVVATLKAAFDVCLDEKVVTGHWEKVHEDSDREYYVWHLPDEVSQPCPAEVTIRISSPQWEVHFEYAVDVRSTIPGTESAWADLPEAYLPWFLLIQGEDGMTLQEMQLAQRVVSPGIAKRQHEPLLKIYQNQGLLQAQEKKWQIAESRAAFQEPPPGDVDWVVWFCGAPSLLWSLYRRMALLYPGVQWPQIVVYGKPPVLLSYWKARFVGKVYRYLRARGVRLVKPADLVPQRS